jgi:hypothetical protein
MPSSAPDLAFRSTPLQSAMASQPSPARSAAAISPWLRSPPCSSACPTCRASKHSGMLKTTWDENRHPRWSAGTSDSRGGQFRPADAADAAASATDPPTRTTQAIPFPGAIPFPFELPLPTEIMPFGPIIVPDGMERDGIPQNPYPDNPDCEEQWAHAKAECIDKSKRKQLKPGRSGFGADIARCMRGLVSEACGGNPVQWLTAWWIGARQ